MYRVTIKNNTQKATAISDDQLMLSLSIPASGSTSFVLRSEDDKDRLTPQLVQLDAIDGIDVDVAPVESV